MKLWVLLKSFEEWWSICVLDCLETINQVRVKPHILSYGGSDVRWIFKGFTMFSGAYLMQGVAGAWTVMCVVAPVLVPLPCLLRFILRRSRTYVTSHRIRSCPFSALFPPWFLPYSPTLRFSFSWFFWLERWGPPRKLASHAAIQFCTVGTAFTQGQQEKKPAL